MESAPQGEETWRVRKMSNEFVKLKRRKDACLFSLGAPQTVPKEEKAGEE